MSRIYVSFTPYIAKGLRHELADKQGVIDIPDHIRSDKYWKKAYPLFSDRQIKLLPSLRELFLSSLRTGKEGNWFQPYSRAYSEQEYANFPDSDEKRDELVAFSMPKTLTIGHTTIMPTDTTTMDATIGQQFRQACIYHFYDLFAAFLHKHSYECMDNKQKFSICDAIQLFSDEYDFTTSEQHALRVQYYRRRIKPI